MEGRGLAKSLSPISILARSNLPLLEYRLTNISSLMPFMGVGVGTAIAVALRLYIFAPTKVEAADGETEP